MNHLLNSMALLLRSMHRCSWLSLSITKLFMHTQLSSILCWRQDAWFSPSFEDYYFIQEDLGAPPCGSFWCRSRSKSWWEEVLFGDCWWLFKIHLGLFLQVEEWDPTNLHRLLHWNASKNLVATARKINGGDATYYPVFFWETFISLRLPVSIVLMLYLVFRFPCQIGVLLPIGGPRVKFLSSVN